MYFLLPSTCLFVITLISGSVVALSSSHWIFLWAGLEINLLSFIPLIVQFNINQETERAVKYFVIQALGSGVLLLSGLIRLMQVEVLFDSFYITILLFCRVIIKIGAAPFHFWFPHVISSCSWLICVVLSTWQKIAPVGVLILLLGSLKVNIFYIISRLNALIGGIGGINQSQVRALMAYSSIGHIGWIIGACIISQSLSLIYLVLYIVLTLGVIISFGKVNLSLRRTSLMVGSRLLFLSCRIIILFSLGGLPPLLGFLPKWIVIEQLVIVSPFWVLFVLIVGSLINLFYYLTISINFFLNKFTRGLRIMVNKASWSVSLARLSLFVGPSVLLIT